MIETPSYYDPDDKLLTPQVVAKRIGVHQETVYRWLRAGFLAFVRIGPRRKMVRESEVRRVLLERRMPAA